MTYTTFSLNFTFVVFCLTLGFIVNGNSIIKTFNLNWECENCGDARNYPFIFHMVRKAMFQGSREVYLNFDNSWIDEALIYGQHVIVRNINREKLSEYSMPPDIKSPSDLITSRKSREVYYVVISLPSHENILPDFELPYREALKIDYFLTHNPCWIPIHDPPVRQYGAEHPIHEQDVRGSSEPTCDNHPKRADLPVPDLYLMTDSQRDGIYEYSSIFLRLPVMHFKATCTLYTHVTQVQFPKNCPPANDNTTVYVSHLGSIGWANCVVSHSFMFSQLNLMFFSFSIPCWIVLSKL